MPCCAAESKNYSVDISVQFMGYLRRVRISGEKRASQGRQEKGTIVTTYVLYCFDARGVVVVQYCFKWGLLYGGGTVQIIARPNNIEKKWKRRPPASKLTRSSSVMAFKNCSSGPTLSSKDALSYAIVRAEKSASNDQQQADARR